MTAPGLGSRAAEQRARGGAWVPPTSATHLSIPGQGSPGVTPRLESPLPDAQGHARSSCLGTQAQPLTGSAEAHVAQLMDPPHVPTGQGPESATAMATGRRGWCESPRGLPSALTLDTGTVKSRRQQLRPQKQNAQDEGRLQPGTTVDRCAIEKPL